MVNKLNLEWEEAGNAKGQGCNEASPQLARRIAQCNNWTRRLPPVALYRHGKCLITLYHYSQLQAMSLCEHLIVAPPYPTVLSVTN